jgi:hypothetical protein
VSDLAQLGSNKRPWIGARFKDKKERDCVQVFEDRKYPPDKEFGCFAAVRGPTGSQWEEKALLRIHMGAAKGRTTMKADHVALTLPLHDLRKCAIFLYTAQSDRCQDHHDLYVMGLPALGKNMQLSNRINFKSNLCSSIELHFFVNNRRRQDVRPLSSKMDSHCTFSDEPNQVSQLFLP